jgi:uncharacterized phage-associated protein
MAIDTKKYKQVILYLCANLSKEVRGKKKLAKLLYFVDFDFFEKKQESITGDNYRALPMGPFPVHMDEIVEQMTKEKTLEVEAIEELNGYNPTQIYTSTQRPDESVFSEEEKQMLDRIIMKYGLLNGKQLEDLSHSEAPYIGTELKEEIPYELAFYRGTDFEENA